MNGKGEQDARTAAALLLIPGGLALIGVVLGAVGALVSPVPQISGLRTAMVTLGGLLLGGGSVWLHFMIKERRPWARWAAVVLVSTIAVAVGGFVLAVVREGEHGAGYVLIGGVQIIAICVGIDVLLLRSSTGRVFRVGRS